MNENYRRILNRIAELEDELQEELHQQMENQIENGKVVWQKKWLMLRYN